MRKILKNKKLKIILFASGALILAAGVFYGGFFLGSMQKQSPALVEKDLPAADFSLFWDAVNLVKSKYVDIQSVKDQDLLYGAIRGIFGALDDPYSSFFNPSDTKKFTQDLTGSFGGIGAELGIRNNQLIIVAPLKGNPAEAVGLKAGDRILEINGTSTADLSIDGSVKLIRGEPGTDVVLLIARENWTEPKEFKITRAIIIVPTLDWEMLALSEAEGKRIAHIRLYNFNANAPELFYEAALSALLKGARGVVLDLRNNPGGFLEVANNISSWFLKRGSLIVREQFAPDEYQDFLADGNSALEDLPVVVLVNGGSASASEIVTGALRDIRGIQVVGEKTFGKGTVQEVQNLKDGSSVKISIAKWFTPGGHEINKKGITPDFEVKISDEDVKAGLDPQLKKAIEVLKPQVDEMKARFIITPIID